MNKPELSPTTGPQSVPFRPWKFWTAIVCLCALLAGIFWWMNRTLQRGTRASEPLPRYLRVAETLQAVERDGREVSSASLDGKVRLFACLYTVCPHGCAAVMGQMKKLHEAHGNRPDFQQVSITVVPDRDTPELLTAFAEGMGAGQSSSWWFLTGRQSALWDFMSKGLGMAPPVPIPPDERLNPLDLYAHDLRIVLVDRKGWVRGYYEVFHPQPEIASLICERLAEDVSRLLDDPDL
ncbi:SCO family protein [Verrucomicrobium spinosum]|uniref:SCO family protein n=2 Tax=Verrucomicrobium spinosum TaxID=2736 RepID=UPI0001744B60|nr:SCO family protein [Verrucomicrobium spinosum]